MKKRTSIISLLLVLAMLVGNVAMMAIGASAEETAYEAPEIAVSDTVDVWDKSKLTEPTTLDEDGTTILLTSAAEVAYFLTNTTSDNTASYRLTTDVDLGNKRFSLNTSRSFAGVLDGDGHTIVGLQFWMSGYSGSGYLFHSVTGTIKNLNLKNANGEALNGTAALINSASGATLQNLHLNYTFLNGYASALCASATNCTIDGITVSGTISSSGTGKNGGAVIADLNGGTVNNVVNYATYTKTNSNVCGGIIGSIAGNAATVTNCINYGNLTMKGSNGIGGIVGRITVTGCVIENCANYGAVTCEASGDNPVGGILGENTENASRTYTIKGCVNYGAITNNNGRAGGIIGRHGVTSTSIAYDCINYGDITGATNVGGLIGVSNGKHYGNQDAHLRFVNCANYGDVTATAGYAGGYVGYLERGDKSTTAYSFESVIVQGTVTGVTGAGGLIGYISSSSATSACSISLTNVYLEVNLVAANETTQLGRLAARTHYTSDDPLNVNMAASSYYCLKVKGFDSTGAEVATLYDHYNANGVGGTEDLSGTLAVGLSGMIDILNKYAGESSLSLWERDEKTGYAVVTGILVSGSDTLSVWDGETYTQPTAVDEKTGDILIQSAAEFMWLLNNVTTADTATYRMTVDVNLSAAAMTDKNADTQSFAATLDGDGHKVVGVRLNGGNSPTCVIRTVTGTIKDLAFEGVTLTGGYNIALVGTLNGTLSGVTVEGQVTARGPSLLAYNMKAGALIENCTTYGSITGNNNSPAAALVLYMDGGTLRGCRNYATITKTDDKTTTTGGLAGEAKSTECVIEDCVNYGDITVAKNKGHIGGIIGLVEAKITLRNCVNYGNITQRASGADVGGIAGKIGKNSGTTYTVTGCINYGDLESAGGRVGGILGHHNFSATSIATNCANYGSVTGTTAVGGLVGESNGKHYGHQDAHLRFVNCASYGDVTATTGNAGGYVGYFERGSKSTTTHAFQNVLIQGTVTGATGAGALIGWINSSDATSSCKISLTNVFLEVTLKATTKTTRLGRLAGGSHYTSDDPLNVNTAASSNVYLNVKGYDSTGMAVEALSDHFNANNVAGTEDLSGVLLSGTTALADGTVAGLMNTFAGLNSYASWLQGESAPELIPCVLKLTSANLHLGSKLTMNLKMKASIVSTIQQKITAIYVTNGKASFVGELVDDIYIFAVTGINAQDFSNASQWSVVVKIDGTEYVGLNATEYSPVKYAERMYADSTDEVKQVLEGMINYAYYAEVVANGSSSLLIDFNQACGAALSTYDAKDLYDAALVRGDVDGTALNQVVSLGANLTNGVNLVFVAKEGVTVNSLTLAVSGQTFTYTPDAGRVEVTGLHAGMIGAKLTITVDTSEGIVTATYAIANYLDMVANAGELTQNQQNLARAAALYMAAVRDYALS